MGIASLVTGIFSDPSQTFRAIDEQPGRRALVPFLLIMLFPAALLAAYYYSVNIDWLQEKLLTGATQAQREAMQSMMSRNVLLALGVIGLVVTMPLFNALYALYFFLIAKTKNLPQSYGKWFAFVAWCSLPIILLLPIGLFNVLTAPAGQMLPEELNAVSLNQLWLHLSADSPWKTLFESLSLISIWSAILMALGYRAWAKVSLESALIVVLIPNLLIYGTWAGIILLATAS